MTAHRGQPTGTYPYWCREIIAEEDKRVCNHLEALVEDDKRTIEALQKASKEWEEKYWDVIRQPDSHEGD